MHHSGIILYNPAMAEDQGKEDKFDFTSDGEELGYISLDQAILLARQQAQEEEERHRRRLEWDEFVWSEISAEEREDTFRIVLRFRQPGRIVREEQTGEEEFVFDQTGALVFRQVLAWPERRESQEDLSPPTIISSVDDEDEIQSSSDEAPLENHESEDDEPLTYEYQGDEHPPNDEFEFTLTDESIEYISLEDARVLAIRHARQNTEVYGPDYQDVSMVWEPAGEEEGEEFYEIKLSFRPAGPFTGTPGLEQFVISKSGDIELRQVLKLIALRRVGHSSVPKMLLFGGLAAAVIVGIAIAVSTSALGSGDDGDTEERILSNLNDDQKSLAPFLTSTPMPTYTPYPTGTTAPTPTARVIMVTPTISPQLTPVPNMKTAIVPKNVVTINPNESTYGTMITWDATGFAADSPIIVTYGPESHRVATGISDKEGTSSGTFRIPSGPDFLSSNTVEVTDDSGNVASTLHNIPIPAIDSSSYVSPAGSTITVTGRHFPVKKPLSDVTIGGIAANYKPADLFTDDLGGFEIELWIPHMSKGMRSLVANVQDDNQMVSVETQLEITRRLPPILTLDSNQGIRNSSVKWIVERTLFNSPLTIRYGNDRTVVATSTSNAFGEASGEFFVPADSFIPSENLVSAIEAGGTSASTPHAVPAAVVDLEWSRVAAGSSIELVGRNFPQSAPMSVAEIGGISVLPYPGTITDLRGKFKFDVLVPQQIPGQKSVVIQVGTGIDAINVAVDLWVVAADPISVGWDEISLNAEPWEETGRSKECPEGQCLRASAIPNNSYAEMNLILFNKTDSRFDPYMERTSISFEIKTSTEACCDILRVEHDGSIIDSWSGNTEWKQIQFGLTSARPSMVQWIYQKDDAITSGDDTVWIRNIQMR